MRFYFLQELAGDLNFYEPIERDRDTALGYYDDKQLLALTGKAKNKYSPCCHPIINPKPAPSQIGKLLLQPARTVCVKCTISFVPLFIFIEN